MAREVFEAVHSIGGKDFAIVDRYYPGEYSGFELMQNNLVVKGNHENTVAISKPNQKCITSEPVIMPVVNGDAYELQSGGELTIFVPENPKNPTTIRILDNKQA